MITAALRPYLRAHTFKVPSIFPFPMPRQDSRGGRPCSITSPTMPGPRSNSLGVLCVHVHVCEDKGKEQASSSILPTWFF